MKIANIAIEWAAKSAFDTRALIDHPSVKFSALEARARAPFQQHRLLALGATMRPSCSVLSSQPSEQTLPLASTARHSLRRLDGGFSTEASREALPGRLETRDARGPALGPRRASRGQGIAMADPNQQNLAQMQAQMMAQQQAQRQAQQQVHPQAHPQGAVPMLTPQQMAQLQQQQQLQQPMMGQQPGAPVVMMMPGIATAPQQAPQQELTLAQIAAQANAKAAAKPKKKPGPKGKKAQEAAAAAAGGQPVQLPGAPVAAAARPAAAARHTAVPLRQRPPADIVNELRGNLDLIRREFAENMALAAQKGREYEPPAFQVRSQHDAAVGIELWLRKHISNFNRDELEKKVAMIQGIQEKCRRGDLHPVSNTHRIEALACWVELTKMYYICVRESRNLTLRGVTGIESPTFRLPDTSKSIPPPLPSDDGFTVAELDAAIAAVAGPQKWIEAVEKAMIQAGA